MEICPYIYSLQMERKNLARKLTRIRLLSVWMLEEWEKETKTLCTNRRRKTQNYYKIHSLCFFYTLCVLSIYLSNSFLILFLSCFVYYNLLYFFAIIIYYLGFFSNPTTKQNINNKPNMKNE
jgi:hypothetical protein